MVLAEYHMPGDGSGLWADVIVLMKVQCWYRRCVEGVGLVSEAW